MLPDSIQKLPINRTVFPKSFSWTDGNHSDQSLVVGVIGTKHLTSQTGKPCPCCQQYISKNDFDSNSLKNKDDIPQSDSGYSSEDLVIAEGWLYKKGTGTDWIGSRSWKPRWTKLVLRRELGSNIDVPFLLIFWYPKSLNPSTIIKLTSKVIIPVDKNADVWNKFCFDVAQGGAEQSSSSTRTFSAACKDRNTWVNIINTTLRLYEKSKMNDRKEKELQRRRSYTSELPPSPSRPPRSPSPMHRRALSPHHLRSLSPLSQRSVSPSAHRDLSSSTRPSSISPSRMFPPRGNKTLSPLSARTSSPPSQKYIDAMPSKEPRYFDVRSLPH